MRSAGVCGEQQEAELDGAAEQPGDVRHDHKNGEFFSMYTRSSVCGAAALGSGDNLVIFSVFFNIVGSRIK